MSQAQTIGVRKYNPETAEGYVLLNPLNYSKTYLLDNCGRIINNWNASTSNSAYAEITPEGTLLKTENHSNTEFSAGGAAGWIFEQSWEGEKIWEYLISDSLMRLHHDIELMPNGNLLAIAWEKKNTIESLIAGRNPNTLTRGELWPTVIIEIKRIYPDSAEIVWEWHAWDHLVQDYDSTQFNYGDVSEQIGKLDINKGNVNNTSDWAHVNAIDYNAELDQIMLSSPMFNELWIINHAGTTEDAATTFGDIMWRWGNPASYNAGDSTDQQLFFQHNGEWITKGSKFKGAVSVYSNRDIINDTMKSVVKVVQPVFDTISNKYIQIGLTYLPELPTYEYVLVDTLMSPRVSGVEIQGNDNILITSGVNGRIIEIDENEKVVWDYLVPISGGDIQEQGTQLNRGASVFKLNKYEVSYAGFQDKDLNPFFTIELNGLNCSTIGVNEVVLSKNNIKVYPNPAKNVVVVESDKIDELLQITDIYGREILTIKNKHMQELDVSQLASGVYFIKSEKSLPVKFVKE